MYREDAESGAGVAAGNKYFLIRIFFYLTQSQRQRMKKVLERSKRLTSRLEMLASRLELEMKVKQRFTMISQSRRRPLLGVGVG